MKTLKTIFEKEFPAITGIQLMERENIYRKFRRINEEWLTQKLTIPKNLCNQFCKKVCKLCLLDDAISKTELLEELK